MERTQLQQNELDRIERQILISLFGKEEIPNATAEMLRLARINPNDYIAMLEERLIPIMKESGRIDGGKLKAMITLFKPSICKYVDIPDGDFLLSENVGNLARLIVPGLRGNE